LPQNLILASASSARRAILSQAGVEHSWQPAGIDENAIKEAGRAAGKPVDAVALELARAKAAKISKKNPQAYVIGADQMMICDDRWMDKPADLDEARSHLLFLRGKIHSLISAASIWRHGRECWHDSAVTHMGLRGFSDDFFDAYLADGGPEILESVGAYRLEGLGVQLFDRIDGDYFTILGLPLLPLLAFLRREGMLPI